MNKILNYSLDTNIKIVEEWKSPTLVVNEVSGPPHELAFGVELRQRSIF